MEKEWQKILSLIKEQVSPTNFKTWFSQTTLGSIGDGKIVIIVPSAFVKGQLIARYDKLLSESVEKILGSKHQLEYLIDSSKFLQPQAQAEEEDIFSFNQQTTNTLSNVNLNPKYTLNNFVVGLTNNLAYAAAQAVIQNPGISYNPLFIYGPSGVGKTHLMQAIGNAILQKDPYLKIIYASSEKFMNDFVQSIQTKATGSFRQRYRSCNILLIDDIQFISGKDSTQEEFFHTYNDLHSRNSQLVFTSDRPPNEIEKLESRLASRFQGGLMVDVQLPDFDTRMAILKAKLSEKGEDLPEEFLNLIAQGITSNTRELEGKLTQILQRRRLSSSLLTIEEVRRVLGKGETEKPANLSPSQVLESVTKYFKVSMDQITGPRRQKELVLPRQIAMFLIYEECKTPFEKIGEILGGRDHTTIMHGVEKIRELAGRDREIQRVMIEIKNQLNIKD